MYNWLHKHIFYFSTQTVQTLYKDHPWLLKALNTSLETAVQLIDTGPVWQLPHDVKWNSKNLKFTKDYDLQNCLNIHEVAIVVTLVKALLKGGVPTSSIGVIATYRAQVAQISQYLEEMSVEVSTVDQFQGRDKNVVIYSCTKSADGAKGSKDTSKFEILEDKRRLTVAITRAKRKLLIVGDVTTLQRLSTFSKILPALEKNTIKFDSSWPTVFNSLH
ncbi:hypothetical protein Zmor_004829 [Zophobas morio]|uniref:DNA replication ATP-dependent helicase/nuclease n=1 Tax=Zophobas morio TaxID=2755281 RepID=A0AA38ISU1_9CUCU|nr:hypothetical protein Zmor_004829 [Zophobas morio]